MVANRLMLTLHRFRTQILTFSIAFCLLIPDTYAAGKAQGKLNINTASRQELCALPFIGPERADKLLECRVLLGEVTSAESLLTCDTIGPDTLKAIAPYIKVTGPSDFVPESSGNKIQVGNVFSPRKISTSPGDIVMLADSDYFPVLLEKISNAQENIDLAMFVFRTTKSSKNRATIILKRLIAAAKRGVKIRVFLERSGHDEKLNETNEETARRLRKHGIKVIFDSPKITTHTKTVVIDKRFSIVGSHNFTHSALKNNHELSLLVDSPPLAEELTTYLNEIESEK